MCWTLAYWAPLFALPSSFLCQSFSSSFFLFCFLFPFLVLLALFLISSFTLSFICFCVCVCVTMWCGPLILLVCFHIYFLLKLNYLVKYIVQYNLVCLMSHEITNFFVVVVNFDINSRYPLPDLYK